MREAFAAVALVVPFVLGTASADTGPRGHEVFTFADPAIVESSGLVALGDRFVTVNDSGDGARVFVVDPGSGRTVGTTTWSGEPVDDEALAPAGPGAVWVGDLGDNTGSRDTVSVVRVPVGSTDRSVPGATYSLAYPHGAPDAETLLSDPRSGRLFVVTKGVFGGVLYAAPRQLDADRVNRLRPRGRVLGIATDGAFFPDGRHLVVRDYSQAVVYAWPSLREVAELALPHQKQGEGIAVDADSRVYVSSEGLSQPVLEVPLPRRVADVVAPPPPSPSTTPAPDDPGYSREGRELPEPEPTDRDPWQWLLGTGVLVLAGVVLLRALRPR